MLFYQQRKISRSQMKTGYVFQVRFDCLSHFAQWKYFALINYIIFVNNFLLSHYCAECDKMCQWGLKMTTSDLRFALKSQKISIKTPWQHFFSSKQTCGITAWVFIKGWSPLYVNGCVVSACVRMESMHYLDNHTIYRDATFFNLTGTLWRWSQLDMVLIGWTLTILFLIISITTQDIEMRSFAIYQGPSCM